MISLFVALLASSPAYAQGVVTAREGYVQVNGRAVELGDPFRSASEAITEKDSVLRVNFADSSFVHAGPKSRFSTMATPQNIVVSLAAGWVWVRAGQDRLLSVVAPQDFKVEAEGADFIVRVGEGGEGGGPQVLVLEGSVRVMQNGKTRTTDGSDVTADDMPLMSELSAGRLAGVAIERKFLYDLMRRLNKGASAADAALIEQGVRRDGKYHGVLEQWSGEKGLQLRANYNDGILDGPYSTFYSDHKPREIGHYENGRKSGVWTAYYESGVIADEGKYLEGWRVGLWKFYSSSGRLVRQWNFSEQGPSAVPRWQWGLAYLNAIQKQGDWHAGSALVTRCLWCEASVTPRFDIATSWMKFQGESSGLVFAAHVGLDVVLGPVVARFLYGVEYFNKDPLRNSLGVELTRVVGRDFHSRDWQPFVRVSIVEMGKTSDITMIQAGLWEVF